MSYTKNNISLIRANTDTSAFQSGVIDESQILAYSNLFYPYIQDNANNVSSKSLTIDIVNENIFDPNPKFEENLVEKDRYTGNLLSNPYIWGFKEASNLTKHSKALSNAFSFNGQKITFHIAKQGHLNGYIDKTYIYCQTTINISVIDVSSGISKNLYSFSSFNSDVNDLSRFFTWTIPEKNESAFSEFGLFGFFVLKLEVINKLYTDASSI